MWKFKILKENEIINKKYTNQDKCLLVIYWKLTDSHKKCKKHIIQSYCRGTFYNYAKCTYEMAWRVHLVPCITSLLNYILQNPFLYWYRSFCTKEKSFKTAFNSTYQTVSYPLQIQYFVLFLWLSYFNL